MVNIFESMENTEKMIHVVVTTINTISWHLMTTRLSGSDSGKESSWSGYTRLDEVF